MATSGYAYGCKAARTGQAGRQTDRVLGRCRNYRTGAVLDCITQVAQVRSWCGSCVVTDMQRDTTSISVLRATYLPCYPIPKTEVLHNPLSLSVVQTKESRGQV